MKILEDIRAYIARFLTRLKPIGKFLYILQIISSLTYNTHASDRYMCVFLYTSDKAMDHNSKIAGFALKNTL